MKRLLAMPSDYKLFVGHDYPPGDREESAFSTVGEQRQLNKHVNVDTVEEVFAKFRRERDAVLGSPTLLHPALQVNICAGVLPRADEDGRVFFKIPVKFNSATFGDRL